MNFKTKKLSGILAVVLAASLTSGCVVHAGTGHGHGSVDSVFGDIEVDRGSEMGNLSVVNGDIEMANDSSARNLDTVNGSIELERSVSIKSAETVNGDIEARSELRVERNLETVNGNIEVEENSVIGGSIDSVNGDIILNGVEVGESLNNHNGDIRLKGNTLVKGDIHFVRNHGSNFSWGWSKDNRPVLKIDEDVVVEGKIILERRVDLQFENPDMKHKVVERYSAE